MSAAGTSVTTPLGAQVSGAAPMVPSRYRVVGHLQETADTVTLEVTPLDEPLPAERPGQFHMLYAVGVGEVPISVSALSTGAGTGPTFTVRAVGAVTDALAALPVGAVIGLRGPFGTGWEPETAAGGDVAVVAGGLGLAPLRPVVHHLSAHRGDFGAVAVVIGARRPDELIFAAEIEEWARRDDLGVEVTVDTADRTWTGAVGLVTTRLAGLAVDPARVTAFVCGPEVMMRFTARDLVDLGVAAERIRVSVERNMRCAVGHCGHCQFGAHLVCRSGPVLPFPAVQSLMEVREL